MDHGRFISTTFTLLENGASLSLEMEDSLVHSLNYFATILLSKDLEVKADWLWSKAVHLYRGKSIKILHSYSRFLTTTRNFLRAFEVLKESSSLEQSEVMLYESLENIKSFIVDRWHFRMLNDRIRNRCYEQAIMQAVAAIPNCIVLDIGGGSGLLSIYAKRAGAKHVYCCEMSASLATIARQCIEDNGYSTSSDITIISKHSKDIQIGLDIPSKVHLIVTELVDSGLLGEHIISVLEDAQSRLLVENGVIIPHSATVIGQPIASREILARQHILESDSTSSWSDIWRDLYKYDSSTKLLVDDHYTCESLQSFPYTRLAAPQVLLEVHCYDPTLTITRNTPFSVHESGSFDAIIYWYILHLTPTSYGDDNNSCRISFSTHTDREFCGWDQAVTFLSKSLSSHSDSSIHNIEINDRIDVSNNWSPQTVIAGDQITITTSLHQPSYDLLNFHSQILSSTTATKATITSNAVATGKNSEYLSQQLIGEMDLCRLNDSQLINMYCDTIADCLNQITSTSSSSVSVLELGGQWLSHVCLTLTALGKAMAVGYGDSGFNGHTTVSATVLCDSDRQRIILQSHVTDWRLTAPVNVLAGCLMDVFSSKQITADTSPFRLIICDVIEGCGLIKQNILREIKFALQFLTSSTSTEDQVGHRTMKPHIVPHAVTVVVSLLHCPSLRSQHVISEDATGLLGIHTRLNPFGATLLRELDLRHIADLRYLSEPLEASDISLWRLEEEEYPPKNSPLAVNVPVTVGGICHAVAIWFRLQMSEVGSDVLDTGPKVNLPTTGKDGTRGHWRQAAFLLEHPIELLVGQSLLIDLHVDLTLGVWLSTPRLSATS